MSHRTTEDSDDLSPWLLGAEWCGAFVLCGVVAALTGMQIRPPALFLFWLLIASLLWPATRRVARLARLRDSSGGRGVLAATVALVAFAFWGPHAAVSFVLNVLVPAAATIAALMALMRSRGPHDAQESAT
jgi:amino acid transporter